MKIKELIKYKLEKEYNDLIFNCNEILIPVVEKDNEVEDIIPFIIIRSNSEDIHLSLNDFDIINDSEREITSNEWIDLKHWLRLNNVNYFSEVNYTVLNQIWNKNNPSFLIEYYDLYSKTEEEKEICEQSGYDSEKYSESILLSNTFFEGDIIKDARFWIIKEREVSDSKLLEPHIVMLTIDGSIRLYFSLMEEDKIIRVDNINISDNELEDKIEYYLDIFNRWKIELNSKFRSHIDEAREIWSEIGNNNNYPNTWLSLA